MMRENQHSDRLKLIVEERMKGCDPPGTEEMWARFKATRFAGRRRMRRAGRPLLALLAAGAAALLVLIFISFSGPPKQFQTVAERAEAPKPISTGEKNKALPAGKREGSSPLPAGEKSFNLEELKAKASFPVRLPAYIPKGYRLAGCSGEEKAGGLIKITIRYKANRKCITVEEWGSANAAYTQNRTSNAADYKATGVKVGGVQGTLIQRKNGGWLSLSWGKGSVRYRISGCLSPEEALKMAESMPRI